MNHLVNVEGFPLQLLWSGTITLDWQLITARHRKSLRKMLRLIETCCVRVLPYGKVQSISPQGVPK